MRSASMPLCDRFNEWLNANCLYSSASTSILFHECHPHSISAQQTNVSWPLHAFAMEGCCRSQWRGNPMEAWTNWIQKNAFVEEMNGVRWWMFRRRSKANTLNRKSWQACIERIHFGRWQSFAMHYINVSLVKKCHCFPSGFTPFTVHRHTPCY